MTASLINIVIDYASKYSVKGPSVVQPVVHAVYMDNPKMTLCGKRPVSYTVVDHAGQSTSCEKCRELISALPEPLAPKPATGKRKRRRNPPRDVESRRADRRQWNREIFEAEDPAVKEQRAATKSLSRAWFITPKGHALLAKWAAEEEAENK